MRYTHLDRTALYKVRVVYGAGPLRLTANDTHAIHGPLTKAFEVLEFDIPAEATAGGVLNLTWTGSTGKGGPGRGCQVAEVWLMKR
jgi:hypothetical protein